MKSMLRVPLNTGTLTNNLVLLVCSYTNGRGLLDISMASKKFKTLITENIHKGILNSAEHTTWRTITVRIGSTL